MARNSMPWFKFFPTDWLVDSRLRAVSLEARGLWIDLLCHMHTNDRRGYLRLNGNPVTLPQLAQMTGCTTEQVSRCLAELQSAGVASALEDGTIVSRRMISEEKTRAICTEAGKKGGNPNLTRKPKKAKDGRGLTLDPTLDPTPPPTLDPTLASEVCSFSSLSEEIKEEKKERHSGVGGVGEGERNGRGLTLDPTPLPTRNGTMPHDLFGEEVVAKGKASKRRPIVSQQDSEERFVRFWEVYPKRVKRKAAERAWARLNVTEELLAKILASLREQMKRWKDPKYIPYPSTWLNDHQWEDELEVKLPTPEPVDQKAKAKAARERIWQRKEAERGE